MENKGESDQTVENKGESDHFLEVLDLEILEIPPAKRPFGNDPFAGPDKRTHNIEVSDTASAQTASAIMSSIPDPCSVDLFLAAKLPISRGKNPPKNHWQNVPRNVFGNISPGFLQKPFPGMSVSMIWGRY